MDEVVTGDELVADARVSSRFAVASVDATAKVSTGADGFGAGSLEALVGTSLCRVTVCALTVDVGDDVSALCLVVDDFEVEAGSVGSSIVDDAEVAAGASEDSADSAFFVVGPADESEDADSEEVD